MTAIDLALAARNRQAFDAARLPSYLSENGIAVVCGLCPPPLANAAFPQPRAAERSGDNTVDRGFTEAALRKR